MKVTKNRKGKTETTCKLSSLKLGDVFRFTDITFEEALTGKNDATFYMVIVKAENMPDDRVKVVSLDGKSIVARDSGRLVIEHKAELLISE